MYLNIVLSTQNCSIDAHTNADTEFEIVTKMTNSPEYDCQCTFHIKQESSSSKLRHEWFVWTFSALSCQEGHKDLGVRNTFIQRVSFSFKG